MNVLRRAEKLVLDAFGRAMPVVNWAFFTVGLAGAAGTVAGVLPPFSNSLWAKVTPYPERPQCLWHWGPLAFLE